jgi:dTDP-4-amino-4,6-dideoxygalactose transaminase
MIPRFKVNYKFLYYINYLFKEKNLIEQEFKTLIKQRFKISYSLLTPSGRSSLYLILKNIKKKKIILPAYTCPNVIEAARLAKMKIIFSELKKYNYNTNFKDSINFIDSDTVVLVTHQYGFINNYKKLKRICRLKKAIIIQDLAPAFDLKYKNNKYVGLDCDYAFFSFDKSKTIHSIEKLGMIVTNDKKNYENLSKLSENQFKQSFIFNFLIFIKFFIYLFLKSKVVYEIFYYIYFKFKNRVTTEKLEKKLFLNSYYKYKPNTFQIFIALKQLKFIDQILHKKKKLYQFYKKNIKYKNLFKLHDKIFKTPPIRFNLNINDKENFYKFLLKKGIDCNFSYSNLYVKKSFTVSYKVSNTIINLPFYYDLSNKDAKYICQAINMYMRESI